MTAQDLAELIRNAREAAGLSQRDLTGLLGRTRSDGFIGRWEKGRSLKTKALFFTALEACGYELVLRRKK